MRILYERVTSLPVPIKIILSFLAVIFTGSILLALPVSQLPSSEATYLDHLFTAVSMVCVTGLYTQPVAETYNTFGQVINMVLMQLGGLGLITVVSAVVMQVGRRVSLRDELTLKEALNREELTNFRRFIISVILFTLTAELLGGLLLSFHFVPRLGLGNGLFTSFYLAVSGFNNA